MHFETLKKDNKKYWLIGTIILVAITFAITFTSSRAYFRTTQSVQIATGIINYSSGDVTIVSIKIKDGDTYTDSDIVPSSGVILNKTESICKVGEEKQNVNIIYKNGKVEITDITKKGTKCTLVFNKVDAVDIVNKLGLTIASGTPDFSKTSCATGTNEGSDCGEATNGLYATTEETNDDYGTSYYFRGTVDNNWVKFGVDKTSGKPIYWRIIRINGNGTMRIIYAGLEQDDGSAPDGTGIEYGHFNDESDDNAYVGYMYGTAGSTSYAETHANTNSSVIKNVLDAWYTNNIAGTAYERLVDGTTGFCGDRSIATYDRDGNASNLGYGQEYTIYAAYERLYINKKPSLKCKQQNDLYTVANESHIGNEALTYPVGLITADEAALAGGVAGAYNLGFYLHMQAFLWTMTPFYYRANTRIEGGGIYETRVADYGYYNPVINLSSEIQFSQGTGTSSDPFVVVSSIESYSVKIESVDLSLSCGAANRLNDVVTSEEVEVEKYVLILDNGAQLEATTQGGNAWSCVDNTSCFSPNTSYNYEFYLITKDGRKSESHYGTLATDNEVCRVF